MKKILTILLMTISVLTLSGCKEPDPVVTPLIEQVKADLVIDDELGEVTLPTDIDGVTISWQSSKPGLITSEGVILIPASDTSTTLTATLTYEDRVMTKLFNVIILGDGSADAAADLNKVQTAINSISFDEYILIDDILLITVIDDLTVTWSSNDDTKLSSTGVVTRPEADAGDATVTLTATISYNELILERDFVFTIPDLTQTVIYTGYYTGADDLAGEFLKAFLHDLIDDHTMRTYSQVSEDLKITDLDPNNSNNIILLYSGASIDKNYRCSSSCPSDSWNKEHVWPQSIGDYGTGDTPGTDLHALRPTYVPINSSRASKDFDNGGTEIFFNSVATGSYTDSDSFEPRDEVKGDVARMIFYMAVRYEGDDGYADLEIDEIVGNGAPTIGILSVLLQWHIDDPVDDFEINRNDAIYALQNNRNPFIDHPEFVLLIWGTD